MTWRRGRWMRTFVIFGRRSARSELRRWLDSAIATIHRPLDSNIGCCWLPQHRQECLCHTALPFTSISRAREDGVAWHTGSPLTSIRQIRQDGVAQTLLSVLVRLGTTEQVNAGSP